MSELNLNWENGGSHRGVGWRRYLMAGVNPHPVATMEKRAKQWSGHIDLPGVAPRIAYADMAAMARDIEEKVRAWFASAVQP